ncbi:MAG: ribonuclease J [Clostridiales bacterium]|nr:ribonuclease J [Clostridiales bacterium]
MKKKIKNLKIRFLGGVGEIGKNMTALEYGDDIIIVDAGLTFPSMDMPGIDLVIPDTTFLAQNREKVRGIVLTHGHEDHIGALPYLLKEVNMPVYGTKLTLALAENKLREQGVKGVKLNCVKPSNKVKLGCFTVEFINVNHSIAGSCALAITTPVGVIVHSGDFKVDLTPINGNIVDITRFSEIGKKGVLLFMCESTNVEREGYSMSERVVGETLDKIFVSNQKRRLIIATFASNVYRIQQIINLAIKHKRKVAFLGRSMINVAETAKKIGEMTIPDGVVVDIDRVKNIQDKDLVILSTGSQGEPMSALTRLASDDVNQVRVNSNDTIVISASPIPGNEKSVYNVINNLYRKGAEVIYDDLNSIHVSGHACQEELKILHSLLKPKFFIPIHGEYRHLKKHCILAKELGMRESNMLICDIGDTVELTNKSMKRGESFQAGSKLVDGLTIDDASSLVRDRLHLAEDGILVAFSSISAESGEFIQEPSFILKGVVLSEEQLNDCKNIVYRTVSDFDVKDDTPELRHRLRKALKNYIYKKTKNTPMIVPVITKL